MMLVIDKKSLERYIGVAECYLLNNIPHPTSFDTDFSMSHLPSSQRAPITLRPTRPPPTILGQTFYSTGKPAERVDLEIAFVVDCLYLLVFTVCFSGFETGCPRQGAPHASPPPPRGSSTSMKGTETTPLASFTTSGCWYELAVPLADFVLLDSTSSKQHITAQVICNHLSCLTARL